MEFSSFMLLSHLVIFVSFYFQEFLVQRVEEEHLVKQNSQCKDFLIEAMKYHLLKPELKLLYKTPRTKIRTPLGLPKVRHDVL